MKNLLAIPISCLGAIFCSGYNISSDGYKLDPNAGERIMIYSGIALVFIFGAYIYEMIKEAK